MLIGLDYYYSIVTGKTVRGPPKCPVAIESILGWIICGPTDIKSAEKTTRVNFISTSSDNTEHDDVLRNELKHFWEVESCGFNKENDVYDSFMNDIKFDGDRYITKLPFKPHADILPDNYRHSMQRLNSLKKKLDKNKELKESYHEIINSYEKSGIIEKVDSPGEPGKVHYLPHRSVLREDKQTTKVRVVFDGSAKEDGPSINESLYTGPCLLPCIFNILLRFRLYKIGLISDIQQAFLNIGICDEHKDYLRFLWCSKDDDETLIIYRFLRVVFGINSSPFLLNGTIIHHLKKYLHSSKELSETFLRDLYVDDSTTGVNTVQEGVKFFELAKSCMKEAGFNLRKWFSNSEELMSLINLKENTASVGKSDKVLNEEQFERKDLRKVLGLLWDGESDDLVYNFENIAEEALNLQLTKRNVLRVGARFYDPLGLISPVVVVTKILFQHLCIDKLDWDEELPKEFQSRWLNYVKKLKKISQISVPRYCFLGASNVVTSINLHGFSDSSINAYSAVIYAQVETSHGFTSSLITSKTKVAPVKRLSIPRLELLGCLLLATLMQSVCEAFKDVIVVNKKYFWTDSEISLAWIKNSNKEWKLWVENRVNKIRDLSDKNDWFHVPGDINPADIPTREFDLLLFGENNLWWHGPSFLTTGEELPQQLEQFEITAEECITSELKRSMVHVNMIDSLNNQVEIKNTENIQEKNKSIKNEKIINNKNTKEKILNNKKYDGNNLHGIINVERFSSYLKLLRVTAFVLRFINNTKKGVQKMCGVITSKEIDSTEMLWIKSEQNFIRLDPQFKNLEKQLSLFSDDGILRLKGRFGNSSLAFEHKYPILLRNTSYFTKLVILNAHKRVGHLRLLGTLNELRSKFWICKGRQTVKSTIGKCVTCIKVIGKTLIGPTSPSLPDYRVTSHFAFQKIGLDYAGPLHVKDIYTNDASDMHKAYACLFTCASTRNVHLELTPNMGADSLIRCLKRFISRRGSLELVISDNFKTFLSDKVKQYLASERITWNFILPKSPWWGGFYERLIRVVKEAMKKSIGKARLNYEELETVLLEIEMIINSRPLTYLYDDPSEALTPSHLVIGRRLQSHGVTCIEVGEDQSRDSMNERLKYLETLLDHYWSRFNIEYMNELRERHLSNLRGKKDDDRELHVGDMVLIKDDALKRNQWGQGVVEKLIVGNDDNV